MENILYHYRLCVLNFFFSHFNDSCCYAFFVDHFFFFLVSLFLDANQKFKIEKVKHGHKQLIFTTAVLNWIVAKEYHTQIYRKNVRIHRMHIESHRIASYRLL